MRWGADAEDTSMKRSHFSFVSALLFPTLLAACGASSDTQDPNGPTPVVDPKGDDDHDGVPNDRDLCPGTKAGAKVDKNGCSAEQRDQPVNTTTTTTTGSTS